MKTVLSLLACAALAGCASSAPVPADKLAKSAASVKAAEEFNAQSDPAAATHLRLAQEQFNAGKEMVAKGDNERAGFMLDRAAADADAALELARAKSSRLEAEKMKQDVAQAKAQLQPGGSK